MIQKIAFIGLGLIGGSFALALKKHRKGLFLIGYDKPDVLKKALERKAIDEAAASIPEAVSDADLVMLAVPIGKILFFLTEIAPHLKHGSLVSDVGSVKSPIIRHAREVLPPSVTFIGGHPMAGSEKSGIHHADPYLFENATYALCPSPLVDAHTFMHRHETLTALIESVGARIIVLDADKHDRIAAVVSHLPQLLSVTLMNYAGNFNEEDDTYLRLAAGGFRDMTRIASSNYAMWKDIFAANNGPIMDVLTGFTAEVLKLRDTFVDQNHASLSHEFSQARSLRDLIPKNSKGFLRPLSDVYVYAEDKPGFLHKLTQVLHEASINIKDLELLKIREGIEGVFRIGFETQSIAEKAIEALRASAYEAFML